MAKQFEFDWDYEAAGELLLRSAEIASVCEEEAARMTRATGVEYVADVHVGKTRANARGYDKTIKEEGHYKKRKDGKFVYTQRRLKEGQ